MNSVGKTLIVLGILFIIIGGIILLGGKLFSWFGKLPGDIHIHKENFTFFAPITSMLIISVVLSIIINIILKILQKF